LKLCRAVISSFLHFFISLIYHKNGLSAGGGRGIKLEKPTFSTFPYDYLHKSGQMTLAGGSNWKNPHFQLFHMSTLAKPVGGRVAGGLN